MSAFGLLTVRKPDFRLVILAAGMVGFVVGKLVDPAYYDHQRLALMIVAADMKIGLAIRPIGYARQGA